MSVAAIILIGELYIRPVIMPINLHNGAGIKIINITSVLAFYLLNITGIQASASLQNTLALLKTGLILLLCTAIGKSNAVTSLTIDPRPPIHLS
jgi:APA family basic amino acid/polyamine antiporter